MKQRSYRITALIVAALALSACEYVRLDLRHGAAHAAEHLRHGEIAPVLTRQDGQCSESGQGGASTKASAGGWRSASRSAMLQIVTNG